MGDVETVLRERLGPNRVGLKKAMGLAARVLEEGEEIRTAAAAAWRKVGRGVLVVTDRRVLFVSHAIVSPGGLFEWQLASVRQVSSQRRGELLLGTPDGPRLFDHVGPKGRETEIVALLSA